MNIDPTDQPKFDQLIADFIYFTQKYGDDFPGLMLAKFFSQFGDRLNALNDEEKSFIFASGVESLQKVAGMMHDEIFPFGHAGQPLEIQE